MRVRGACSYDLTMLPRLAPSLTHRVDDREGGRIRN